MPQFPIHGSPWFDLREFVDNRTFGLLGANASTQVDPKIVRICDLVREKTGLATVINNWHYAKRGEHVYKSSGFRAVWDSTGAQLSQHRAGRAADIKVAGLTPAQVLAIVMQNQAEFAAAGLTRIENIEFTKTWLHLDCAPGVDVSSGFLIVDP